MKVKVCQGQWMLWETSSPTFLSPASFARDRAFFKSSNASALFFPPGTESRQKMQPLSPSVKVFKAVPNRNPVLGLVCCSWSHLLQGGELPHCACPQIRWTWQCALGQGPLPCSKRPGEQSAKLFLSALKHCKATGKCCVYSHTSCWRQLLPWFLWTCPLLHFAVRQLGSGRLKPSFLKTTAGCEAH